MKPEGLDIKLQGTSLVSGSFETKVGWVTWLALLVNTSYHSTLPLIRASIIMLVFIFGLVLLD